LGLRGKRKQDWRKLHNEELNDLHSSPYVVREIKLRGMRWAGNVAHMREKRGMCRILVGKPEGKGPLGRPRHRWEDNTRMDFRKWVVGVWSGSNCPRIGTGGGHL